VIGAKYGVGNVTLGLALYLSLTSESWDTSTSVTTTSGGATSKTVTTSKGNNDVVKFGIPVTFNVSF